MNKRLGKHAPPTIDSRSFDQSDDRDWTRRVRSRENKAFEPHTQTQTQSLTGCVNARPLLVDQYSIESITVSEAANDPTWWTNGLYW